ncbi:lysophospholipid acyltransferase family protein [Nocardioides yefusunii]|uniref:Lysophospholipid acyltransferase family protein n=1 Tax=Nocardioides yefusunii TaxID=2500546 RepID=A0ABW1QVA8_9ACTN|nr:lysophospholipid acyltransferase family protein [Nocardioides yefusunii]
MGRKKPVHPNLGFSVVVGTLIPLVRALITREDRGVEKLPTSGAVLAFNHVSHFDPFVTGLFVYDQGILPSYLVKEGLFRNPWLAKLLRSAGQIEVKRMTTDAANAYEHAVSALAEGRLVCVYPEGTLTRDPDLWPMRGKTGVARMALATGAPVIPVGHWGVQELLPPYAKRLRPFPRKKAVVQVGEPVDLDDLRGRELTPEVITEATERIMSAIVSLVEDLRGEKAPAERFDPRRAGMAEIGDPSRHRTSPAETPQSLPEQPQNTKDDDA